MAGLCGGKFRVRGKQGSVSCDLSQSLRIGLEGEAYNLEF